MATWTIAWWTETEQQQAAVAVGAALKEWAVQWTGESLLPTVECAPWPGAGEHADWQCLTGSGDRDGVWMSHPERVARGFAAALCDDEDDEGLPAVRHGGPLSQAVGKQAAHALAASLCANFDWTVSDDSPCALPAGTERGGLSLSIRVGHAHASIVLSAGVARAVTGRRLEVASTPLAALLDVVGRRPITLNVALRPVRLEIGSLCTLAIGDVVALDHKLDDPVTLHAEDASPVAEANLSKIGSQKAIRLERAAP